MMLNLRQKCVASVLWLAFFLALFSCTSAQAEPRGFTKMMGHLCGNAEATQNIMEIIEKRHGEVLAGYVTANGNLIKVFFLPESSTKKETVQTMLFFPDGSSCIMSVGSPLTINRGAGYPGA